jgi:hypothetical protein
MFWNAWRVSKANNKMLRSSIRATKPNQVVEEKGAGK